MTDAPMADELVERLIKSAYAALVKQHDNREVAIQGLGECWAQRPGQVLVDGYVDLDAIARACLEAIEAAGLVIVPKERTWPTADEVLAYIKAHPEQISAKVRKNNALYSIAAAPKPPRTEEKKG